MKLLNAFRELRGAHSAAQLAEIEFRRPNTRALNRAINTFCAVVRELREIYALNNEVDEIVATEGSAELNRVMRALDLDDLLANRQLTLRESVVGYRNACDFAAAAVELAGIHASKTADEFSKALGFLSQEGREPMRLAIGAFCYWIALFLENGIHDEVAERSLAAVNAVVKAGDDANVAESVRLTVAFSKRQSGGTFNEELRQLPQSMQEFIARAVTTGLFGSSEEADAETTKRITSAFARRERVETASADAIGLDSETEADVDAALAAIGLL